MTELGHSDDYGRGQVEDPERRALRYRTRFTPLPGRPWSCQCLREDGTPRLRKYRHVHAWDCLREDIVLAHWLAFPKTTYRVVRMLAWLEDSFAR